MALMSSPWFVSQRSAVGLIVAGYEFAAVSCSLRKKAQLNPSETWLISANTQRSRRERATCAPAQSAALKRFKDSPLLKKKNPAALASDWMKNS